MSKQIRYQHEYPKDRIFQFIVNNPGIHLRKIKNSIGYSMGTIQYHVKNLEMDGKIKSKKDGFYRNYYTVGSETDEKVMSLLNLESPRRIILYLIENESSSHMEIAKNLGLSSSTISWHMKKLLDLGIVVTKYKGKFSIYRLQNKKALLLLFYQYKSSTWNHLINNMTELFEASKNELCCYSFYQRFSFSQII